MDGDPTLIVTDTVELAVVRRLDRGNGLPGLAPTGTWPGQSDPRPMAYAALR